MATSWESLMNQALRHTGSKKRIGTAYEGSEVAKAGLELFGQVRDALIRSGNWDFTRRANVSLALLKGPPPASGFGPWTPWTAAYPPPGWNFEYAYPVDCLKFAAIVPPPVLYPILLPRAANWRVDDDSFDSNAQPVAPYKVILSNMPAALCVYRAKVTNPSLWTADFTETFIDALAAAMQADPRVKQAEQQTAVAVGMAAERQRG